MMAKLVGIVFWLPALFTIEAVGAVIHLWEKVFGHEQP